MRGLAVPIPSHCTNAPWLLGFFAGLLRDSAEAAGRRGSQKLVVRGQKSEHKADTVRPGRTCKSCPELRRALTTVRTFSLYPVVIQHAPSLCEGLASGGFRLTVAVFVRERTREQHVAEGRATFPFIRRHEIAKELVRSVGRGAWRAMRTSSLSLGAGAARRTGTRRIRGLADVGMLGKEQGAGNREQGKRCEIRGARRWEAA
jgi:hypothetical protein